MMMQILGLKKESVINMFQEMESDFLSEKAIMDDELKRLMEENDNLRVQLTEQPRNNTILYEDEPAWNLSKDRVKGITNYLREQKEQEMTDMRDNFSERKNAIQLQIKELDVEMQSAVQLFTKMFHLASNLVEQSGELGIVEQLEVEEIEIEQLEVEQIEIKALRVVKNEELEILVEQTVQPLEEELVKPKETTSEMGRVEDSLIEQIEAIKSQYIVGKVAGEDLADLQGNLIIAKFDVITRQVVNQAHREGRLAELIVNMKISGLGED